MMYRIIKEKNIPVILAIDPAVLLEASVKITDGNAASDRTRVFMKLNGLDELQWDIIKGECWTGENESEKKRIMSAEVLVPNKISPDQIRCIFCHDYRQLLHCQKLCPETIPVSINPYYYFKG